MVFQGLQGGGNGSLARANVVSKFLFKSVLTNSLLGPASVQMRQWKSGFCPFSLRAL